MRSICISLLLAMMLFAQQAIFYNRPNGLDPLTVGMKNDQPIAIDWDEDGRTDILTRNIYSTVYGEPWWGIYFFRNIGLNSKPRYAAFQRLTLNNRPIDDIYASYQILDFNDDGCPDLLSELFYCWNKNQ